LRSYAGRKNYFYQERSLSNWHDTLISELSTRRK